MSESEYHPDPSQRLATLEQQLRARTFELQVLYELSSKIGASLTYEELFRAILLHLREAVSYDVAASLLVAAQNCCNLYLRRFRPLSPAVQAEMEDRLLTACGRLGGLSLRRDEITLIPVEEMVGSGSPVDQLGSFFQVPILADGRPVGLLFVGAEGHERFTEEHIRLLYTVANQASAAVQRIQALLETERRRLRTVVDHLPEGVVLLDGERRVTAANPAGRKLLEGLAGIRVGEILARVGGHAFGGLAAKSPCDLVLDAPVRQVVQATVVRLDEDSPEPWLLTLRDVTDVREAIHRRDHFLAMLSHELRNPLSALTSAAQLLQKEGAVREWACDVIVRQLRHMNRLVDDLLDVSRFLHGKIQLQKEPVDLGPLVCGTVEARRQSFEDEGKQLLSDVQPGPLTVQGDAARLTQILDNLLSNARKYTPAGGLTRVTCAAEENEVVLRVRDTGRGIPPQKCAEIFEPFMQAEDSLDRSLGGLGLGLALVKALVEMHDGTVSVHSEGPGKGSEFTVRLPLISRPEEAPPSAGEPAGASAGVTPCRRILIVEDEPDARKALQSLLQLCGHEVFVASNGSEGLSAFHQHCPDIALIDIGLPGIDGYQLVRKLRADSRGTSTRLVAISGYAQPEDRRRAIEAGFDLHLPKPIRMDHLERILAVGDFLEADTMPDPGETTT